MFAADVGMFAHAQIIQGFENAGIHRAAGRGAATATNHTFATDRRRLTARVRTVGGFPVADSWRRISARPAGTGAAALSHCTPVRLPVGGALLAGAGLGLRVSLEGGDRRGSFGQS